MRPATCVLIAGALAAGKSTVAHLLTARSGGCLVPVRHALERALGLVNADRRTLQEEGAALDRRTNGRWLVEHLLERSEDEPFLIVDSVRTLRQTIPILTRVPNASLVYLETDLTTRRQRFSIAARDDPVKRSMSFADAMRHPTEGEVTKLRPVANLAIDTNDLSPGEVVSEIENLLRQG